MKPCVRVHVGQIFAVIPFTVNVHCEPNGVRNPSRCDCARKEGFLGTRRASE
jgi:hypothetical protein